MNNQIPFKSLADKESYEAIQFAISNAKSINGELIVKVTYDNVFRSWMLDCGELTLMLSSALVALKVIHHLNDGA